MRGNFSWIKNNPTENWESKAFAKDEEGYFYCGVRRAQISGVSRLHVVFVARDQTDKMLRVVGIYAAASTVNPYDGFAQVKTKHALLFRIGNRPRVVSWPGNQGVRRWARRIEGDSGADHPQLRQFFERLKKLLLENKLNQNSVPDGHTGPEIQEFEGEERKRFIKHRMREARLRDEKLQEALRLNQGSLTCEVPRCGLDFLKIYGPLGGGYAQVHHKKPLSAAPQKGRKTTLGDLAVVCANCHAMIHRGGMCRPLAKLIPPPARTTAISPREIPTSYHA
jgi:hypothetical protein